MSTDIHREILKLSIIELIKCHNFDSIELSALEVLTDVIEDFFKALSFYSNSNANLTGRTESNFHDIMVAVQNLNIRFSELKKYCIDFKNQPVSKDLKKKIKDETYKQHHFLFNKSFFLEKNNNQLKHVPSYLPPFPDQYAFKKTPIYNARDENPKRIKELKDQQRVQAENALSRLHQHSMGDPFIINYDQVHDPQTRHDKGGLFSKPKDIMELVEEITDFVIPQTKINPTPIPFDHPRIKKLTEGRGDDFYSHYNAFTPKTPFDTEDRERIEKILSLTHEDNAVDTIDGQPKVKQFKEYGMTDIPTTSTSNTTTTTTTMVVES